MQFKEWILNEEIWPNGTATVYHRTNASVLEIVMHGFAVGEGALYGNGLYTTFAIESQFNDRMERSYGTNLVKFKASNLDQYVICHKGVAQQILGENYKISKQLTRLKLSDLYDHEQIQNFDEIMEKNKISSELALLMFGKNKKLQYRATGIIYYGENDGYCLLKYMPVNDGKLMLIGFSKDVSGKDLNKMQELKSNCEKNEEGKCENPWITSYSKTSIKSLYNKKNDPYINKWTAFNYSVLDNVMSKDLKNKDKNLQFYLKKYLDHIEYSTQVYYFLSNAKDKKLIAKILGSKNINKLVSQDIRSLIIKSDDRLETAKIIIDYKKNLLSKDIFNLFISVFDKNKIAELLGKDNIKKLNKSDRQDLIEYDEKIEKILEKYI
jgi:hypothetical protein